MFIKEYSVSAAVGSISTALIRMGIDNESKLSIFSLH